MLEPLHEKALKLYYDYMCIGGMPISILDYIEKNKDINKIDDENKSNNNYSIFSRYDKNIQKT